MWRETKNENGDICASNIKQSESERGMQSELDVFAAAAAASGGGVRYMV